MKQYYNLKMILTLGLGLGLSSAWAQTTVLDYTGDLVTYTVPAGVTNVNIEALGAQGASGDASYLGGRGARMSGDFAVTPGETLIIAVGGQGAGQSSGSNGGGGGGSFVVRESPGSGYTMGAGAGAFAGTEVEPLIIAGGGGGTRTSVSANGNPGVIGNQGTSGSGSGMTGGGTPITAPEMGGTISSSSWGSAGGGFVGDGSADGTYGNGGSSFINGAAGGTGGTGGGDVASGGFGAGGQGRGYYGGGGGGGYSGGQGGRVAGGGGSYNVGTSADNASDYNSGDGQVTIVVLCMGLTTDIPVTGVCIGDDLTLYAESTTGGTITWDGGVDNGVPFAPPLGTTTYTATSSSTDDCGFTIEISASEVPTIEANSSLPSACEGAYITLWGTGGDTYTWTGTGAVTPMDSIPFGAEDGSITYTVIGSILGCEGPAADITLEGAPQPDVVANAEPEQLCVGGSYTLTGSGDAVGYDWGGTITDGDALTPETAGTFVHTVVGVSADGCTDTAFVSVIVNPTPIVDAGSDVAVCEGDEVTLSGSGAETYTWTGGVTDGTPFEATAGETTYTVTGTDVNGCSDDDEVVVTGVELPYVDSYIITNEAFGYDGEIDITPAGGSGDYTYSWSHGPTTEDVDGLTAGTYTVTIDDITIDPGMCSVEEEFTLISTLGVDGESKIILAAFPNPTANNVTITYNGAFNYVVTNMVGEIVANGNALNSQLISLENVASGTYIVKVTDGENTNYVQVVKK